MCLVIIHDLDAGVLSTVNSSTAVETVDGEYTKDESSEPEDEGEEGEGLSSTPLTAVVAAAEREARPVPGAAAVDTLEPPDEDTEDSSPTSSEDKVGDVASHGRGGRDGPDNGSDDGERRPDDRVDKAGEWANAMASTLVKEVCGKTKHDSCEDELSSAEDEGSEA